MRLRGEAAFTPLESPTAAPDYEARIAELERVYGQFAVGGGDYFRDPNLTTLAFSRIDPTVSIDWKTAAPGTGVGADNFSVRWAGKVIPRFSEAYTFRITADDGARLWIGGQTAID